MRPAVTALLDQADAATGHAHGVMHALADHEGTRVRYATPGPVTARIVTAMQQRMLRQATAGHPTLCPHLPHDAPRAAFWAPHAPGLIRCPTCFHHAVQRIRGTREDRTCDGCRRHVARIAPCAAQLPALVVDLGDAIPPTSTPPIAVHYGLCGRCKTTDLRGTA